MATYGDLMRLVELSPPYAINGQLCHRLTGSSVAGEPPAPNDDQASTLVEQKICDAIKLVVLGEVAPAGVKVFSEYHRKSFIIPDVGRMSYETLLKLAGPIVKTCVMKSKSDDVPGMVSLAQVREAIALLA